MGGLVSDSLVPRYPPQTRIDGPPGEEGTFNMCSFWLVEALTSAGLADVEKLDHARLLLERVLGDSNHLGLYSEQTGPQGEALGNFPQGFTHLGHPEEIRGVQPPRSTVITNDKDARSRVFGPAH
jgi:GH15 family glucan-1,4-alpha-glucosidase